MVDEQTGAIEIQPAVLEKLQDGVFLKSVSVNYTEQAGTTEPGNWKVSVSGKEVYNATAGKVAECDTLVESNDVTFAVSGLSADAAVALISKQAVIIDYTVEAFSPTLKLNNSGHGKFYATLNPGPDDKPIDSIQVKYATEVKTEIDPNDPSIAHVIYTNPDGEIVEIYVVADDGYDIDGFNDFVNPVKDDTEIISAFKHHQDIVEFDNTQHAKFVDENGNIIDKLPIDSGSTIEKKKNDDGTWEITFTNDEGKKVVVKVIPDDRYVLDDLDVPYPPVVGPGTKITPKTSFEEITVPLETDDPHIKYYDKPNPGPGDTPLDHVVVKYDSDIKVIDDPDNKGGKIVVFIDEDGNETKVYVTPDSHYVVEDVDIPTKVTDDTKVVASGDFEKQNVTFKNDGNGHVEDIDGNIVETTPIDHGSKTTVKPNPDVPGQGIIAFTNPDGKVTTFNIVPNENYDFDKVVGLPEVIENPVEANVYFKLEQFNVTFSGENGSFFYDLEKTKPVPAEGFKVDYGTALSKSIKDQDSGHQVGVVEFADGKVVYAFGATEAFQFDQFTNSPFSTSITTDQNIQAKFKTSQIKVVFPEDYPAIDDKGVSHTEIYVDYGTTVTGEPAGDEGKKNGKITFTDPEGNITEYKVEVNDPDKQFDKFTGLPEDGIITEDTNVGIITKISQYLVTFTFEDAVPHGYVCTQPDGLGERLDSVMADFGTVINGSKMDEGGSCRGQLEFVKDAAIVATYYVIPSNVQYSYIDSICNPDKTVEQATEVFNRMETSQYNIGLISIEGQGSVYTDFTGIFEKIVEHELSEVEIDQFGVPGNID